MENLIEFVSHDSEEQTVTVIFNGSEYDIKYIIDEDGDKVLLHNDGYCESTSALTADYPNNEDYASDDELYRILSLVK